uniref:ribosomal protein S2 n=1 Tax=Chlamydomonas chlamydogama TaxID=225041 RepID=UPI00226CCA91|nr:ribosomal protein S2 [Chlamydomonas chlamydogama]UZA61941.1 ribosomal protein S2 [Chlamydomonas chlamydogama]
MAVQETKTRSKRKPNVGSKKSLAGLKPNFAKSTNISLVKSKNLKVGDICNLNISALGPNGVGIDEYSYSHSIFVPNVQLGDKVKAKIVKLNLKDSKYAVAKMVESTKSDSTIETTKLGVQPDQILTVDIKKLNEKGAGLVDLNNNYKLLVPNASSGNNIKVKVTRVKSKYAFAKIVDQTKNTESVSMKSQSGLVVGSKVSLLLPTNGKRYGKFVIIKLQGSVMFIKLNLGAKLGDKVRIKVMKVNSKFAIAKIIQINPTSLLKKQILVQHNIRQMIKNGMHFGEKAVKCNARMKSYIWFKKQGANINRPLIKKGRHIINLLKTRRCLNKALTQLSKYALKGRTFLFIGTKKPASGLISRVSLFSKTSFFVNTRWLGGMLTNWKTILKSISKIRPILKEKQKIVKDILEKRQNIKLRLIKKALLLKNKNKLILNKGRLLINQFKNETVKTQLLEKALKLSLKRKELIQQSYSLLEKRQVLIEKRKELMIQSQFLKEKAIQTVLRYKNLLNQLTNYNKKLRELKSLLLLSKEIKSIKTLANKENKNIINISYGKVKELGNNTSNLAILPNPPKDILNQIVLVMKNKYDYETSLENVTPKTTSNNTALVLSKLISNFSRFAPYIKSLIKTIEKNSNEILNSCQSALNELTKIKQTLQNYLSLKLELVNALNIIKLQLTTKSKIISIVRKKLKQFEAQKKLIKYLPRLRFLPTPKTKIAEIVQILMKKIVDPKLKYPVDTIYDEKLNTNSKKLATARKKKWQRLEKYFGGISNMTKLSKSKIYKNVAIIVGQKEEMNAVRECQKLGIKTFTIVDTNCNPTFANHVIPANDDSRNSIKYILNKFLVRIRLAQKLRLNFQKHTINPFTTSFLASKTKTKALRPTGSYKKP